MNMNECTRGTGMFRLALATVLFAGIVTAQASVAQENQKLLQQKMDSLDVKRGIEIGGTVRSVFNRSYFVSDQDVDGINIMPDREQNEFTQFDLKLGFRPWEQTRANVILRLGAGMQEYFAAASKTVSVAWMNVEGRVGNSFYWVAGDFRQQISPLTIYSPDIEIMYEPEIYRRNRYMAQDQVFLQGNQRNLQGVNLQYRDEFGDAIGQVRAEGIFSRLRRAENLDKSGAMGNILPNENIPGASQASGMDKYLASANFEVFPMNKNLMFGATQMLVWDNKKSLVREWSLDSNYIRTVQSALDTIDSTYYYKYGPINELDTLPQKTFVTSIRLGADVGGLLGSKSLILDMTAEYAMSNDRIYSESATAKTTTAIDPVTGATIIVPLTVTDAYGNLVDTLYDLSNEHKDISGTSLLASFNIGYKEENTWIARITAKYLQSDTNWFNNLAQSPSFFAQRILNSEKDANTSKYGVNSPMYSTFDAMYHFTPKFSPISLKFANDDNGMIGGQSESYNIAPYAKNSWTTTVFTRQELALVNNLADPTVQLALPNGLATSNRAGFTLNPIAGYGKNNAIEIQGLFTSMTENQVLKGDEKAKYSEVGGGAKVDVFQLIGFSVPCEISGSYKASTREKASTELKTTFINAGLYMKYFKRFGIAAGYQQASMKLNDDALAMAMWGLGVDVPVAEGKQNQWMVGLDYSLSKNAWLALNYGRINVKNTYKSLTPLAGAMETVDEQLVESTKTIDPVSNFPTYLNVTTKPGVTEVVHEFSMNLVEASINVDF